MGMATTHHHRHDPITTATAWLAYTLILVTATGLAALAITAITR
jgi:hypothetical protein